MGGGGVSSHTDTPLATSPTDSPHCHPRGAAPMNAACRTTFSGTAPSRPYCTSGRRKRRSLL
eukprot:4972866-Prymnesium_polylepis.1